MPQEYKSTSRAVERTLAIVEALAQRGNMTSGDIARRLGIPKTSAWYILHTLEHHAYLVRDPVAGSYRLSSKVVRLSQNAMTDAQIKELAGPVLAKLQEQTRLVAVLGQFDTVVRCVNIPGLKLQDVAGPRMELHASAGGKLCLAHMPPPEILAILKQRGMPRWTPHTITQQSRLMAELAQIRRQGYAVDYEESIRGLRCIAAPIFGPLGMLKASIGVAGVVEQIGDNRISQLATVIKEAAGGISETLRNQRMN